MSRSVLTVAYLQRHGGAGAGEKAVDGQRLCRQTLPEARDVWSLARSNARMPGSAQPLRMGGAPTGSVELPVCLLCLCRPRPGAKARVLWGGLCLCRPWTATP